MAASKRLPILKMPQALPGNHRQGTLTPTVPAQANYSVTRDHDKVVITSSTNDRDLPGNIQEVDNKPAGSEEDVRQWQHDLRRSSH